MAQLARLGFAPIVDKAIEEEALSVLGKLRIKHALGFDPADGLRAYMAYARIMSLPLAQAHRSRHINRADHHVYSAALHYRAWILTGDIKLAAECQALPIAVRLPWDVIMVTATQDRKAPPLNYVLHCIGLSKSQGSLFARVIPGSWGGMKAVGRFTVCEVENVAQLLYDSDTQEWVFNTKLGYKARAKCHLGQNEQWMVCGSYEMDTRNGDGDATLRASNTQGAKIDSSITLKGAFTSLTPGTASFGHSASGADFWNGALRKVVVSPHSMGKNAWAALRKVPGAAPDPTAGNILEAALRRVRHVDGKMVVPTEREIRESWV